MKKIFIVTDFSEASQNAGKYAIQLAKFWRADVALFNVYQTPVQVPESYIVYSPEDVWASTRELLEKEAKLINPDNLVTVELCGSIGVPADTIVAEAEKRNVDVIVCGMKGMGKTFRKIFGSTTTSLTRKSDIPLIIVPENANFVAPKNIALASDMDPKTSAATVDFLKVIGEKFASKLSVIWVVDEGEDVTYEMRFRPLGFINQLKSLDPVFGFPTGSSITKALDEFVKENTMDMLVMIPHKHDLIERFFKESITKEMIFHSHIPLLILPQKVNEEITDESTSKQAAQ